MNKYMIKHFKKLNKASEVWLGGRLGGLDIVRISGHFFWMASFNILP